MQGSGIVNNPSDETIKYFSLIDNLSININPRYVKITGNFSDGLLLTLILSIYKANNYRPFGVTDSYLLKHSILTASTLKGAKRRLVKLLVMRVERVGVPPICHYFPDLEQIVKLCL